MARFCYWLDEHCGAVTQDLYVIRVVDLYPELIVSQNRLGLNHWAIKMMRRIDEWIAQGAAHVIVLTNSFARVYQEDRKIPPEKISIIPDWVEGDLDCVNIDEAKGIRQQFKIIDEDFLVAYGGNIGVAAGVDTLVKACASIDDIRVPHCRWWQRVAYVSRAG